MAIRPRGYGIGAMSGEPTVADKSALRVAALCARLQVLRDMTIACGITREESAAYLKFYLRNSTWLADHEGRLH